MIILFVIYSLLIGCATEINGHFCGKNIVVHAGWGEVMTNVGVIFWVTGQKRSVNTGLVNKRLDLSSNLTAVEELECYK